MNCIVLQKYKYHVILWRLGHRRSKSLWLVSTSKRLACVASKASRYSLYHSDHCCGTKNSCLIKGYSLTKRIVAETCPVTCPNDVSPCVFRPVRQSNDCFSEYVHEKRISDISTFFFIRRWHYLYNVFFKSYSTEIYYLSSISLNQKAVAYWWYRSDGEIIK